MRPFLARHDAMALIYIRHMHEKDAERPIPLSLSKPRCEIHEARSAGAAIVEPVPARCFAVASPQVR